MRRCSCPRRGNSVHMPSWCTQRKRSLPDLSVGLTLRGGYTSCVRQPDACTGLSPQHPDDTEGRDLYVCAPLARAGNNPSLQRHPDTEHRDYLLCARQPGTCAEVLQLHVRLISQVWNWRTAGSACCCQFLGSSWAMILESSYHLVFPGK